MSSGDMFPEYQCCHVNIMLGHKPTCEFFVEKPGEVCPDGGTCHHICAMVCVRVRIAEPLSWAGFPDDKWPDNIKREHDFRFEEPSDDRQ